MDKEEISVRIPQRHIEFNTYESDEGPVEVVSYKNGDEPIELTDLLGMIVEESVRGCMDFIRSDYVYTVNRENGERMEKASLTVTTDADMIKFIRERLKKLGITYDYKDNLKN